jgi:hypothetical protein
VKPYYFNKLVHFFEISLSKKPEPWLNKFMKNEQKNLNEIICDFGDDFGSLSKQDIGQLFVDIHASISPLDPLNKAAADAAAC